MKHLQGFDGMFLWRLHGRELEERKKSKSLDFIWTGNRNLGKFVSSKLIASLFSDEQSLLIRDE